jgi:hypothetical protein
LRVEIVARRPTPVESPVTYTLEVSRRRSLPVCIAIGNEGFPEVLWDASASNKLEQEFRSGRLALLPASAGFKTVVCINVVVAAMFCST